MNLESDMSTTDVSSKLGEYMLKGWVLTDEICPNENCPVPLMRSPKGHTPVSMFCANCNGDPQNKKSATSGSAQSSSIPRPLSPSTVSSSTRISRSSTPPTDISSDLSSPTFALPVETAESVRRRQQSDAASAEIGVRLLKGWAMLADECPNERCYGVPLVRPPLVGGKDPRKECVACGTVYVDEKDAAGWEHLIVAEQRASFASTAVAGPSFVDATTSVPASAKERRIDKGKVAMNSGNDAREANAMPLALNTQERILEASGVSLQAALQSLSQRLSSLAGHPAAIEPVAIGNTAEAMSKVLHALAQVGNLRGDCGP